MNASGRSYRWFEAAAEMLAKAAERLFAKAYFDPHFLPNLVCSVAG